MSRRGIRFLTPEVVTEIATDELDVLRAELERIADGAPRLSAAAELAGRLDELTVPLHPGAPTFEPDDRERYVLLRAADHLRNLEHVGELMTLRDRLAGTGGVQPIGYRLRSVDGRPAAGFASYSLAYEPGDRLVTAAGTELRVVEVRASEPDDEVLVEPWRPTS